MKFYKRYLNGETKTVYNDIYKLGDDAFLPENIIDIENVLTETFERTAHNLILFIRNLPI